MWAGFRIHLQDSFKFLTYQPFADQQPANMSVPLLFTLPPSNRHEVILIDTSDKPSLKTLNRQITSTIASSPNCAECTYNIFGPPTLRRLHRVPSGEALTCRSHGQVQV